MFNIADCEEKLGRLATSWTLFQEVVQRLPSDDERRTIASERARSLEARVPTLTIHLAHTDRTDVVVRRDGVVLGAASLETALPVDPGEHTVIVEAPGTQKHYLRAKSASASTPSLDVKLGTISTASAPPKDTTSAISGPAAHSSHTAAYVAGGVGVAGVVTGVVAGLVVLSARKTRSTRSASTSAVAKPGSTPPTRARPFGVITTVGLVAGALGLGSATGSIFVRSRRRKSAIERVPRRDPR